MEQENQVQGTEKNAGRVKRFFRAVFVHNIWLKVTALLSSAALWALCVALA